MAFASQYRMPGAYFDPQPVGVHPGVFRPPASPSASSSLYLARSTGSYHSEATTPLAQAKRKRRSDATRDATPLHEWHDGNMNLDGSADLPPHETPKLDREARYTLAGQLETPGAAASSPFENGALDESMYSDADYRRALGSKRPHQEMESPVCSQPTALFQPTQPIVEGWSRFALNTIGGVVGKVWEFCKAGAFRGFSAGGGTAYAIDGQGIPKSEPHPEPGLSMPAYVSAPEPSAQTDEMQTETPSLDATTIDGALPGRFPQPDSMPYNDEIRDDTTTSETTPSRPAVKRRQTSAGNHDELRNWVVVDDTAAASRRSLPRPSARSGSRNLRPSTVTGRRISVPKPRLNATPATTNSSPFRPATSHGNRPGTSHSGVSHARTFSLSPREPASCAVARSPEPPVQLTGPSPSRIPMPVQPAGMTPNPFARTSNPSMRQSGIPSPAPSKTSPQTHRRSQSNASTASSRTKPKEFGVDSIHASPRLDAEARKLAARRVRNEQDSDARIDDFNQRLKEMIRQGREALGTKIEIDDGDGGWMDD